MNWKLWAVLREGLRTSTSKCPKYSSLFSAEWLQERGLSEYGWWRRQIFICDLVSHLNEFSLTFTSDFSHISTLKCHFFLLSSCPVPINILSVLGRWHITSTRHRELENNSGWKGFLEVIWSDRCSDQGKLTSVCWGPCSAEFWTPRGMENPHPLWATFVWVWPHSRWGKTTQHLSRIFPVVTCVCCPFS